MLDFTIFHFSLAVSFLGPPYFKNVSRRFVDCTFQCPYLSLYTLEEGQTPHNIIRPFISDVEI